MKIDCLTIFPEIIEGALAASIPAKARERGLYTLDCYDIRQFTEDKHHKVDDIPYGGGVGMVFKPEPVIRGIKALRQPESLVIHPSPVAPPLEQAHLLELREKQHLIFVASRYEGLDQRVIDHHIDLEYSLGDFVISGGELACAVMIDALVRLIPGALGKAESYEADSFFEGLLDYPHYTRPPEFDGHAVPDVLQSGHHEHIRRWRKKQALERTRRLRPDLLAKANLDKEARRLLLEIEREESAANQAGNSI